MFKAREQELRDKMKSSKVKANGKLVSSSMYAGDDFIGPQPAAPTPKSTSDLMGIQYKKGVREWDVGALLASMH